MTGIATEPEIAAGDADAGGLLSKLEQTRREMMRFGIWLHLARLLLAEAALGSVLMLADWIWVLPAAVRIAGLAAMVVLAVVIVLLARVEYGRDQAAADAEEQFPELGQRLQTVVDYADPARQAIPASPGLLEALVRETDRRTARLDFRRLVPWGAFERRALALFFTALLGVIALFLSPGLRTAALRLLLLPAHYTALHVAPGDVTLKAGDDLNVKVTLSGRPVPGARWLYRFTDGGGRWISGPLTPAREGRMPSRALIGSLTVSLKGCEHDLDYRVTAGELASTVFHVKVVHPLIVKELQATITPPAYTRRPAQTVKDGNLQVIEGSTVRLAVTLNRPATTAAVVLGASGDRDRVTVPLEIQGWRLTGELPALTRDATCEIAAADHDGMKLAADPFQIKVRLDEKPAVRFVHPEESLAVTPTTEVPTQIAAGDDFGVSRAGICYKIGHGPEETLRLEEFPGRPLTADVLATLYLEKHKLRHTDAITYYAFVEDNYSPSPHRSLSELRFIDILPYKQTYQLIEGGGTCNGCSTSLEELIARQRANLNRTFAHEKDQPVDGAAARRLARAEEELRAATAELSQGLSAIAAPVPALDAAVDAMRSATELLEASDLAAALPREEAALTSLISARRNMRKLLAEQKSGLARACRSFDRQQAQRIRRPPAEETKKQLARLTNDINELARREQRFSEEIEPQGRGGAMLDPALEEEQQASSPRQRPGRSSSNRTGAPRPGAVNENPRRQAQLSPAQQQREAVAEAERLRELAKRDEALTELANRRMDAAAQAVKESDRSMQAGRASEAAGQARAAARQLESLARQVGALKAREVTERLARARDLAQAIATAERQLSQAAQRKAEAPEPGANAENDQLAGRQRELAEEVATLADLLKQLRMAAAEEKPELALGIDRAAQSNPPDDVADSMRRSAAAASAGRIAAAVHDADDAARRLDALAQDLESVRRDFAQPQLDRLIAAERQAAELQNLLRSVRQSSQQAEAEKGLTELAQLLDSVSPADGALRQAADKLTDATQRPHAGQWAPGDNSGPGPAGFFVPPVEYAESLGAVILALQARIQELMIDNALVDRNGPVPPQYQSLVEDYYRVLSQDLR
jgi:hypothetical protein